MIFEIVLGAAVGFVLGIAKAASKKKRKKTDKRIDPFEKGSIHTAPWWDFGTRSGRSTGYFY